MKSAPDDAALAGLVESLAGRLLAGGRRMAAAESCTGGWIAKCCTDLAGSSAWFERGFVTYSNEAKHELLGVDGQVLEFAGAVSEAVALLSGGLLFPALPGAGRWAAEGARSLAREVSSARRG